MIHARAAAAALLFMALLPATSEAWEFDVREYYLSTSNAWQWGKPVTQTAYRYADVRLKHAGTLLTEGSVEHEIHGFVGRISGGWGPFINGDLTHKSANSLFENSHSEVGGAMAYAKAEGGYRIIDSRLRLDALVGVMYRYEFVEGQGAIGHTLGTLTADNGQYGSNRRAVTEQTEWFGPTLGLRAKYRVLDNLSVFANVGGSPWLWTGFEETRPLRSVNSPKGYVLQHKATNGEATGGWAFDALGGIEYRITEHLRITAGLSYSYLRSGEGRFHYNPAVPDCRQPQCKPVNFDFRSWSQSWGPFIGVSYRW